MVQAINEVNLPKFLSHDLPLFNGIVSDLFPSSKLSGSDPGSDSDRAHLTAAITTACHVLQLVPTANFVKKVLQVRVVAVSV